MKVWFWLRHPRMLVGRVRYWWWERQNPDKPWLTPGAVDFCADFLTPGMRGWEYGSGRSTAWFAARLGHLVSVEHHEEWHRVVTARLFAAGVTNVTYQLLPLDHPENEPERTVYDPLPRYVAAIAAEPDESLHFVVVDGHYRTQCITSSLPKITQGGYLLVDDLDLWGDDRRIPVPATWERTHESTNGVKRTGIWRKPVNVGAPHS